MRVVKAVKTTVYQTYGRFQAMSC